MRRLIGFMLAVNLVGLILGCEKKPDPVERGKYLVTIPMLAAWAGPWGVSFAANLTPDKETGIAEWSEEALGMRPLWGPGWAAGHRGNFGSGFVAFGMRGNPFGVSASFRGSQV